VAFALTTVVAVSGFILAAQQFVLKFLWDQSAHTRTIAGVLYMTLGVIGLALPFLLYRFRSRIAALSRAGQWLAALGVPLAYVVVFGACMVLSQRSTTLVLPRPFAPTAVLRYTPGSSRVEFHGGWNPEVNSAGYSDAHVINGVEHFSSYLYQGFLNYSRQETVKIAGRAEPTGNGRVQVTLTVDAKEPIKFAAQNLDDATILRDGKAIAESRAQSGTFDIVITGRPREGI
jgi:hypothetical protein